MQTKTPNPDSLWTVTIRRKNPDGPDTEATTRQEAEAAIAAMPLVLAPRDEQIEEDDAGSEYGTWSVKTTLDDAGRELERAWSPDGVEEADGAYPEPCDENGSIEIVFPY